MSPWKQWKRAFDQWEGTTAHFIEQWMKSPLLLEPAGAWLSAAMRVKALADKTTAAWWGSLGLPTKRDQERALHALNKLESRLLDLEEQLEDTREELARVRAHDHEHAA
ncbi:MAG: hypothetical protein H6712_22390 [Myxococcales bacterium]|nr:hypothetical protein [Myxococcales bacterium]MCB9716625.1 hypothetical protein [Myxococcales bacterium]